MARSPKTPTKPDPKTQNRAKKAAKDEPPTQGRVEQVKAVWNMTREQDPKTIPIVIIPAIVVLAVLVVVGLLIGHIIIFSVAAVFAAILTGTSIFGRRATTSMFAQVEGKPGAAAAILQGMRGDWRVTPAVGFTRNQELVHRVVGRAGVVLVGEGNSTTAIRGLIVDQKRRVGRVLPDTPIHDFIIGETEDRTSIRKLQSSLVKLPRTLKNADINGVEARLKALGGASMPIPKGPMPTRMPRGRAR